MAQRLFYRIKEVAHRLGEPVSTIRYWESVFPQVKPHTTPKGVRQYNERDIETLRRIQHLLREKPLYLSHVQTRYFAYARYASNWRTYVTLSTEAICLTRSAI